MLKNCPEATSLRRHPHGNRFDITGPVADDHRRDVECQEQQLATIVRDFLATIDITPNACGIDVAPGTSLLGALAMLPFCAHVELWEHDSGNVNQLQRQLFNLDDCWNRVWKMLLKQRIYQTITAPHATLATLTDVRQAGIADLPRHHWDLGTMFSASHTAPDIADIQNATEAFLAALKPGAPFATGFTAPLAGVYANGLRKILDRAATEVDISLIGTHTPSSVNGMIVATGRIAEGPS